MLWRKSMLRFPANMKHLYNIYTTSAQRLRRWPNIVYMLYKCFVIAGLDSRDILHGIYTIIILRGIDQVDVKIYRPLGYERVYLPLREVADTPFHIQGDDYYDNPDYSIQLRCDRPTQRLSGKIEYLAAPARCP